MKRFAFLLLFGVISVGCSESGLSDGSTSEYGDTSTVYSGDEEYVEDYSEENLGDPCPECNGGGTQTCSDCNGSGRRHCRNCDGTGVDGNGRSCLNCDARGIVGCATEENCSMCSGAGYGSYVTCPRCEGTGQLTFENGNSMTCGGNGGIESAMLMMLDMRTALGASGQSFCGGSGKVFRPN
jgi:hypothetical protein